MKSIHEWLILLSLLGGVFLLKNGNSQRRQMVMLIYVCIIYISAIYVVLQSEPRYSIPQRPLMYLCAMFGLWQISCAAQKLLARKREKNSTEE